jgi:hypothetical protein
MRSKLTVSLAGILLAFVGSSRSSFNTTYAKGQESPGTRLAEGEYKVYGHGAEGGIGPFAPSVYDFVESWTLWRLHDGTLEVTGQRNYDSPQYEPHIDSFLVMLSAAFHVTRITEFQKLRWKPDSGPLTCDFLPTKIDCDSGAKDPQERIHLTVPLERAYGFLWPVSAFSLSNITRFADRDSSHKITVDMITIDESSKANPVAASVLEGHLRFVGQEPLTITAHKWVADKFELKVPLHPSFLIWATPQGLLLDFELEDNNGRVTERGMRLVSFRQWAEF